MGLWNYLFGSKTASEPPSEFDYTPHLTPGQEEELAEKSTAQSYLDSYKAKTARDRLAPKKDFQPRKTSGEDGYEGGGDVDLVTPMLVTGLLLSEGAPQDISVQDTPADTGAGTTNWDTDLTCHPTTPAYEAPVYTPDPTPTWTPDPTPSYTPSYDSSPSYDYGSSSSWDSGSSFDSGSSSW